MLDRKATNACVWGAGLNVVTDIIDNLSSWSYCWIFRVRGTTHKEQEVYKETADRKS